MKKRVKKILAFVLSVIMIFSVMPMTNVFAAEETEGYYTYTVKAEYEEAKITACDKSITGDIIIPSTLGGYPVTSIGGYAFRECNNLTSVTIPDSVTSIGNEAFYSCRNLTNVTFGNGLTSIGGWMFENCTKLTSVTIPDSVISIGGWAFAGCESLTSVTIGNSVKSIGSCAFDNCSNLTSVTIPDSVTSLGYNSFGRCTGLTSLTIGNSVESIGSFAFYECRNLTSVTIPDSVTNIGDGVFEHCLSLTSVTIPDSVKNIGYNVFGDCKNLTGINIYENNANYSSQDGVLFNKDKTELIQYPAGNSRTIYDIPDSVTSIVEYAFNGCSNLTNVTIPNSVTSIGIYAFGNCSSLTSVTIPDSVTSIGNAAFEDCSSLTSIDVDENNENYSSQDGVLFYKYETALIKCPAGNSRTEYTIPSSVTWIDWKAFKGCNNLTKVTIPDSIEYIDEEAFCNCTNLTNVTIPDSVASIGNFAFGYVYDNDNETKIKIPDFTIYGQKDTAAEEYANENEFNFIEVAVQPHEHSFTSFVYKVPTCTESGIRVYICYCDEGYTETIPATGHTDKNDDGWCDNCNAELRSHEPVTPPPTEPTKPCDCKCHSSGFSLFIWKIGNFFHKIFKMDKYYECACGEKHW